MDRFLGLQAIRCLANLWGDRRCRIAESSFPGSLAGRRRGISGDSPPAHALRKVDWVQDTEANDRMGGFGSGFMGGLSGHQGALRAMFLTRRLPDKMAYAATASILALCVDLSRVPVYLVFRSDDLMAHVQICSILVISAVLGARMGKKWLESLKSDLIHRGVMAGIMASGFYYIYEGLA